MFQYDGTIIRVIDGDTIEVNIDLGFHIHHEIVLRLARIDAPEVVNMGAAGIISPAKDYVMTWCPAGSAFVVNITRAEKYGRWLAEVFFSPGETDRWKILASPRCLNDELLRGGFAKEYSGGKK
jgi:micrococcal nuclease